MNKPAAWNKKHVFLILLLLCSCTSYKILPESKVVRGFQTCYSIDSLKLSFTTYAPYDLNTKEINRKQKKLLKRINTNNKSNVLFTAFNDFNYPNYLVGLIENKDFDYGGYDKMISDRSYYSQEVRNKLDTLAIYYTSYQKKNKHLYEVIVPFNNYTLRLVKLADTLLTEEYINEFYRKLFKSVVKTRRLWGKL